MRWTVVVCEVWKLFSCIVSRLSFLHLVGLKSWKAVRFRGRGFKYSKFQWQPKVSFHRGCENCCITAAWAKSGDGGQGSVFRDAHWAEKLLATELRLWWKCPCCFSETAVRSFFYVKEPKTYHHLKIHVNERITAMKEESKYRQAEDEMEKKGVGGGGLHMWVDPDIKASRDTARKEVIPDDNVHMQRNSFPETGRHLILLGMVLIDLGICTSWPERRHCYIIFQHRDISLSFRITSWEFRTKYDGNGQNELQWLLRH